MTVTFYYPDRDQLPQLRKLSPEKDYRYFDIGERIWIVQTYLRLKNAGYPVKLKAHVPPEGIVVFHRDSLGDVQKQDRWNAKTILVCVRADRPPTYSSMIEIVQNRHSIQSSTDLYVPHWPQPGLEPRAKERGDKVQVLAYKGYASQMYEPLQNTKWINFVEQYNLIWRFDSIEWTGRTVSRKSEINWQDYSDVDVIVALRPDLNRRYPEKPASKLVNAWKAGVPAILGPECAYRELRESRYDYIEVRNFTELKQAVLRLRRNPSLYSSMVRNGRERAQAFSVENIIQRWSNVLFHDIPRRMSGWRGGIQQLLPVNIWSLPDKLRERLDTWKP